MVACWCVCVCLCVCVWVHAWEGVTSVFVFGSRWLPRSAPWASINTTHHVPVPSATQPCWERLLETWREASSSECAEEEDDRAVRENRNRNRRGGWQEPESDGKSERREGGRDDTRGGRGRQYRQTKRQSGKSPGLSLAKVELFASCQLVTAALGQRDAALCSFCWLSQLVCLCTRAWMLQSSESSVC